MRWVPSHLLEHLPIHLISDAAAREAGSCWLDIRCNRQADYHAKRAVQRNNLCAGFTKEKLCKLQHGKNGWHMSVQLLVLFAMMMHR